MSALEDFLGMPDPKQAQALLQRLLRADLAALLTDSTYRISEEEQWWDLAIPVIEIATRDPFGEALEALSDQDKKRIAEAIVRADPNLAILQPSVPSLSIRRSGDDRFDATIPELLAKTVIVERLMCDVALNKLRIGDVEDYYRMHRKELLEGLSLRGLDPPELFASLWDWYRYWKETLPSYRDRTDYLRGLFASTKSRLLEARGSSIPLRPETGWEAVDRVVLKARDRLQVAVDPEDYQQVGLLCREVLISLAQAVFVEARHLTQVAPLPSRSDAKGMLDLYFGKELRGESHEYLRSHSRTALKLAVELQHKRSAGRMWAALCLEATTTVVQIVRIIDREIRSNAESSAVEEA